MTSRNKCWESTFVIGWKRKWPWNQQWWCRRCWCLVVIMSGITTLHWWRRYCKWSCTSRRTWYISKWRGKSAKQACGCCADGDCVGMMVIIVFVDSSSSVNDMMLFTLVKIIWCHIVGNSRMGYWVLLWYWSMKKSRFRILSAWSLSCYHSQCCLVAKHHFFFVPKHGMVIWYHHLRLVLLHDGLIS